MNRNIDVHTRAQAKNTTDPPTPSVMTTYPAYYLGRPVAHYRRRYRNLRPERRQPA